MTEPPDKRKRVSRACDICFRKKDKCDGVRPVCTLCKAHKLHCTWDRPSQKRGPPAGQRLALERKVRNLESLLGFLILSSADIVEGAERLLDFGSGSEEDKLQSWSEADKRQAWADSRLGRWLEERDVPEDDIRPAVETSKVTPAPPPSASTGGPPQAETSLPIFPAVIGSDVSMPSPPLALWGPSPPPWTAPLQHSTSATRHGRAPGLSRSSQSDRLSVDDSASSGRSADPVLPRTKLPPPTCSLLLPSDASPSGQENALSGPHEARYAPAGDLYRQSAAQYYAGPPSGFYMLRAKQRAFDPSASERSPPLQIPGHNGENLDEQWLHSQLPSPESSDDEGELGDARSIAGPSEVSPSDAGAALKGSATNEPLAPNDFEEFEFLLDTYFTCVHPFLPFVDKTAVLRWSSTGGGPTNAQNGPTRPHSALILALCAVACTYASQPSAYDVEPPASLKAHQKRHARLRSVYFTRARDLLVPRLGEELNLDVVQSFLLLALSDLVAGQDSRACVWLGIAIHLGQGMALHRANAGIIRPGLAASSNEGSRPEPIYAATAGGYAACDMDKEDAERRKLTYWSCFCLDTLLSFNLGRPTAIHRTGFECRIPITEGPEEWELCRTTTLGALEAGGNLGLIGQSMPKWGGRASKTVRWQALSVFAAFAELCDLVHEIHGLYALPPLVNTSNAVELVQRLHGKLKAWRAGLPLHLASLIDPTASDLNGKPAPPPPVFNLASVYHVGIILLYRPYLDALSDHPLQPLATQECLSSSTCLTDILACYYFAFGPARPPPLTAYYLLTATTVQLWAWAKGGEVGQEAIKWLNQLLALFREIAPYSPPVAGRLHLIQRTLSHRPAPSAGGDPTPPVEPPATLPTEPRPGVRAPLAPEAGGIDLFQDLTAAGSSSDAFLFNDLFDFNLAAFGQTGWQDPSSIDLFGVVSGNGLSTSTHGDGLWGDMTLERNKTTVNIQDSDSLALPSPFSSASGGPSGAV